MVTRKLYEVELSDKFPLFTKLITFLKSRISILENVMESQNSTHTGAGHRLNFSNQITRNRKSDKGGAIFLAVSQDNEVRPTHFPRQSHLAPTDDVRR